MRDAVPNVRHCLAVCGVRLKSACMLHGGGTFCGARIGCDDAGPVLVPVVVATQAVYV